MSVPSYDDLTPGIPDVVDSQAAGNLASLLRELPAFAEATAGKPASGFQLSASGSYACVRLAGSATPAAGSSELEAASGQIQAVLAIARDFSPRVTRVSEHEVLLDVSGLGRLIGPPAEIERQLARALLDARVAARVAIAATQTAARLLAHGGETANGLTLRHKDHNVRKEHELQTNGVCDRCGLHGLCAGTCGRGPWLWLPVDMLRELEMLPPRMNHRDRARPYETLERWGIATLGELAALPAAELSSRLGRRGIALQRLARGLDPAPFVPDGETPRYIGRLELEWPLDTLEPLSFVFARLLEPLSAALERADRGAIAVHLDLRLTDRSTHARLLQLPAPMRDPRVLRTLLLLDLESSPPPAAVDVVSIELDPAPGRITQFSLLQRALPSPETLSTLTARLSALVGEARVGSPVLVDSHRPDAFVMERYVLAGADGAGGAARAGGAAADRASGAGRAAFRRWRPAIAIRVSVQQARPVHIAASRRGVPYGSVIQAAGPWRTSGDWWTASGAGGSGQGKGAGQGNGVGHEGGWNRDEWDVELKSGAACRIYRDRTTERWFLEGIYD